MSDKKFFFFDVDGTLLDHSIHMDEPKQSTFDAFAELRANGHEVVIASARESLPAFFPKEDYDGFVLSNGFFIINEGEVIRNVHFSFKELQYLVKLALEHEGAYFFGGYDGSIECDNGTGLVDIQAKRFGVKRNIIGDTIFEGFETNMATVMFPDEKEMRACIERLPKKYEIHEYTGQTTHIDILLPDYTKGEGVRHLYELKGYDQADVYAFGDGQNDIEMMEVVGFGVAMGNGGDEVKQAADAVTDTVDNDGVVKKLRELGYIQ